MYERRSAVHGGCQLWRVDAALWSDCRRLLPALRDRGVPVIWVNWGNRPDLANMPPNQLHLYKPTGTGTGLGEPLASNGAHVLEKDSWAAAVVDELKPLPEDICVDKYRISGFWDTPLDSILRNLGIRTLMFAGVNTDQCVLHSLTDANFLGYGCVLVEDCCATSSPATWANTASAAILPSVVVLPEPLTPENGFSCSRHFMPYFSATAFIVVIISC